MNIRCALITVCNENHRAVRTSHNDVRKTANVQRVTTFELSERQSANQTSVA